MAKRSKASKSASKALSTQLFSIGYEGRSLEEFVACLRKAKVDRVIDVRALPLSRRKGFSKTPLREALTAAGIEYLHIKEAGNPYRHEQLAIDEILASYAKYIRKHPEVLAVVRDAIQNHRAALLCVEQHVSECHRGVLVNELTRIVPELTVTHL